MKNFVLFLMVLSYPLGLGAQVVKPHQVLPHHLQQFALPPVKTTILLETTNRYSGKPTYSPLIPNYNPDFPCAPFRIGYKTSYSEITVTDQIFNQSQLTRIFPGAILSKSKVLNNGDFTDPLPSQTTMYPQEIRADNIYSLNVDLTRDITVINEGGNEIKDAITHIYMEAMTKSSKQTAKPAMSSFTALIAESDYQINSSIKGQISAKAQVGFAIPIESIFAGGDAHQSAGLTSEISKLQQQKGATALIAYKHTYFTANLSPKSQSNSTGGTSGQFLNMPREQISDDWMYIKSVNYGRILIITISADLTRQEMKIFLEGNLSAGASAGITEAQSGVSMGSNNNASATLSTVSTKVKSVDKIEINVYNWGGIKLVNKVISGADLINEGLANFINKNYLSNPRIEYLSGINGRIPQPVIEQPVPISFVLHSVKSGEPINVNVDHEYYGQMCVKDNSKYDVNIRLDKLECKKHFDCPGESDRIYGKIYLAYWELIDVNTGNKITGKGSDNNKYMWDKSRGSAIPFKAESGKNIKKFYSPDGIIELKGLTYEELMQLQFGLKAIFIDKEGDGGCGFGGGNSDVKYAPCTRCDGPHDSRVFRIKDYKKELDARFISGKSDPAQGEIIDFGGDKFAQLICYEKKGDVNSPRMDAFIQIKILPAK